MDKTKTFIEKAKQKHGNTYLYELVQYTNSVSKVVITCREHGAFQQAANNHLQGQGCPSCALERKVARSKAMALSTDDFINRAREVHHDKYDYTNSVYISGNKPIVIICRQHGKFIVGRAEKHLYGQGCSSCSTKGSLGEEAIAKWLSTHNICFFSSTHL